MLRPLWTQNCFCAKKKSNRFLTKSFPGRFRPCNNVLAQKNFLPPVGVFLFKKENNVFFQQKKQKKTRVFDFFPCQLCWMGFHITKTKKKGICVMDCARLAPHFPPSPGRPGQGDTILIWLSRSAPGGDVLFEGRFQCQRRGHQRIGRCPPTIDIGATPFPSRVRLFCCSRNQVAADKETRTNRWASQKLQRAANRRRPSLATSRAQNSRQ